MNQFLTYKLNEEIIRFVQSFHNSILDKFFISVTITAEEYFVMAVMALLFWCLNKKLGYKIGFAYISSNMINIGLKDLFHIKRPIGESGIRSLRLETAQGYSFPSGHTQGASVLWPSLMIYFKKFWMYIIGILMVFLVGLSRIYLGVHRPIDVIGGILLGIIFTFASNFIFNAIENNKNYLFLLIYIIPMFIAMLFYRDPDFFKMCGLLSSLCIGYIIDDRFIMFNEKSGIIKHILKLVSGIAVMLLIQSGLKIIFPDKIIFHFLRYFLIGIWVTVFAPFLFSKLPDFKKTKYMFVRKN